MAVTVKQEVAALYSAIFNRAPDQAGLEFWVNAIEGGDSLVQAAEGFTQHPVFAETYAGMSDSQFVQQLYVNILGGAGDANGIAFWTEKLASGVSKGQVVAEFVSGALTIDLDALLASGELSQAEYDAAVVRQDSLTNKANVGVYFAETFGAASNLSASTDTTTKEGLESDPVYLASQAAIAGVTNDAATLAAAKAAIDAAEAPTDLLVAPAFTLTEALALEELPEIYSLSDADANFADQTVAGLADSIALANEVIAGATNAAELELNATYTLADTLENLTAAEAAVLEGAASYSLTDEAGDLGSLTEEQIALVQGATNAADFTYGTIGETFTLTEALEDLQAAIQNRADFLEELELDADGVAGEVAAADEKVAEFVGGTYAVDADPLIKSAALQVKQNALNKALTDANKSLADANAEVAKVAGLTNAINAFNTASANLENAETQAETAELNEDLAFATVKVLITTAGVPADDGTVANVIVLDGTTLKVSLPVDATAQQKAAANDLLAAINARIAANTAVETAEAVVENALLNVGYLDFQAGDKTAIGASFRTAIKEANSAALTRTQVQNELNVQTSLASAASDAIDANEKFDEFSLTKVGGLYGFIVDDEFVALTEALPPVAVPDPQGDPVVNQEEIDAAIAQNELIAEFNAAAANIIRFNDLKIAVDEFHGKILVSADGEYTFANMGLLTEVLEAQGAVKDAEADIAELAELLSDLAAAQTNADQLADLDAAIEAAEQAFEDAGFEVPATLDGLTIASAESDIFLVGENTANLVNFGSEGDDLIFIGTNYSFAALGATQEISQRVGDAGALEVFAKQDGGNVVLYVEQQTFAGNSNVGEGLADITTITLTGVSVADLAFANGAITLA